MLSAESFWTSSLRLAPEGGRITRILSAAINAIDPGVAVRRSVVRDGDMLNVSGRVYDLRSFRRVVLLGLGKASVAMSDALAIILADRLSYGLVISKQVSLVSPSPMTYMIGDHPVPDEHSLEAGRKVIELVSSLGPDDLLFCLVSGGGSALVVAPIIGISLAEIQGFTSDLLACGARISEINKLRRRLDLIKGGGIVKMASGATIISLILSDVVGNSLEAIASGPTAPDPSTRADSLSILANYGLETRVPVSILHSLRTSPETPKPGDPLFAKVQNVIVGGNLQAAQAALTQAELEGFHPYLLSAELQGEARQVAYELATTVRQASLTGDPVPAPACIVAGGETTVTLQGNGKGGRNTELALAAVSELADFPGVMLVTLATDGEDGLTDAAGAVVTGGTFRHAAELDLHPGLFLERNDSFTFFSAMDDLLKPGPTGTNGNDLVFLFIF
jgi:hydroxypyruvate reductase